MKLYLGFFLFLTFQTFASTAAEFQDIQAPTPILVDESYVPQYPPTQQKVEIPLNCLNGIFHRLNPCQENRSLEYKLEKEYWKHIALVDSKGMNQWLEKTYWYLRYSGSSMAGRFHMLRIFGHLHVYSSRDKVLDVSRSPHVLKAMNESNLATQKMPNSPNAWAFYWAIRNFTQFALGLQDEGLKSAAEMVFLEDDYAEWGAAGPIGAVAHLMGAYDKEVVRKGITFYDDCRTRPTCQRETSIAPFQYIGTLVTQAEAYGYLGELDKMEETFQKIKEEAKKRNWPFVNQIDHYKQDLVKPGGLIEKWSREGRNKFGSLRVPLGVAHQRLACAFCHAGNTVPEHYYFPERMDE